MVINYPSAKNNPNGIHANGTDATKSTKEMQCHTGTGRTQTANRRES